MSLRCLRSSHSDRPWARTLRLAAEGVGVLVEAAVSSVRDEARGSMGTLRVDPLSYITALISAARALPQADVFLKPRCSFRGIIFSLDHISFTCLPECP